MKVNGVEIYNITDEALKFFRENARNDAKCDKFILRRKFTALIMQGIKTKLKDGFIDYKFGNFHMLVDEENKIIVDVSWEESTSRATIKKDRFISLTLTYKRLGLNADGNKILQVTHD